jgi:DNA-binding transcriptional LysR family regulator
MTITQLEYFQVLAQTQHLLTSAKSLHISPSALSSSLKSLEKELGVELFDRVGRNIILNEYGKEFLKYVENGLESINNGINAVHLLVGARKQVVRFAAPSLIYYLNQRSDFMDVYLSLNVDPVSVDVSTDDTAFWKYDLDFAISAADLRRNPSLNYVDISSEKKQIVMCVSYDNELSELDRCSFKDLENETILMGSSKSAIQIELEKIMAKAGFTPKKVVRVDDYNMPMMAKENFGICFTAETFAYYHELYRDLKTVYVDELRDTALGNYIYWRKEKSLSPSAKKLIDAFCAADKNIAEEMDSH